MALRRSYLKASRCKLLSQTVRTSFCGFLESMHSWKFLRHGCIWRTTFFVEARLILYRILLPLQSTLPIFSYQRPHLSVKNLTFVFSLVLRSLVWIKSAEVSCYERMFLRARLCYVFIFFYFHVHLFSQKWPFCSVWFQHSGFINCLMNSKMNVANLGEYFEKVLHLWSHLWWKTSTSARAVAQAIADNDSFCLQGFVDGHEKRTEP